MKRLGLIAMLCTTCPLFVMAQPIPVQHPGAKAILDEWVTHTEKEIVPAAEAMPEDKYPFVPANGEFTGVRSFAEQITHLAAANYQLAARILGEKPPHGEQSETAPASLRTKAEIIEYLKGSFVYLHKAVATVND